MNIFENITENSIKIEQINKDACRFCIHNTKNLISITSKVSSVEENVTNFISVTDLITNCFGDLDVSIYAANFYFYQCIFIN